MNRQQAHFTPDWVSAPGETVLDMLEEKGWNQTEFSQRIGFTAKHVSHLISGKSSITQDAAIKLERVLGSSARFWMNREAQYREALARKEALIKLEPDVGWLKAFPLADMVKFHWIQKRNQKTAQVDELLKFFGVVSVKAWRERYAQPLAAFRTSEAFANKQESVAAWLRQGERQASTMQMPLFDKQRFKKALIVAHQLTNEAKPSVFMPKLIDACALAGVAVVFAPTPKGCTASGATKWLESDKALLMLSFRYKTNDHFWFSFFHEAGHILLHGKKMLFIEGESLDGECENEANQFAENWLINKRFATQLEDLPLTASSIQGFAKSIGIAPGIVVGRLQNNGRLQWTTPLAKLKISYTWQHSKGNDQAYGKGRK